MVPSFQYYLLLLYYALYRPSCLSCCSFLNPRPLPFVTQCRREKKEASKPVWGPSDSKPCHSVTYYHPATKQGPTMPVSALSGATWSRPPRPASSRKKTLITKDHLGIKRSRPMAFYPVFPPFSHFLLPSPSQGPRHVSLFQVHLTFLGVKALIYHANQQFPQHNHTRGL